MINIDFNGRDLILFCTDSFSFSPSQLHQLAFWGFRSSDSNLSLKVYLNKPEVLLSKLIKYFQKKNLEYTILDKAQSLLIRFLSMRQDLEDCANLAARVKDGDIPKALLEQVSDLNNKRISRPLKDHQLKSLIHLLAARHGANFSVPGSGKTAVVLSAYKIFLETNVCNTLFVVGPLACFTPWENEFSGIFGRQARSIRCAGGDSALRHANYSGYNNNFPDLFLTSFQTLYRDCEQIKHFFKTSGAKVFFVIDEAHYIKQLDGAWANSAAILAPFAVRRCILTGTPFPKSLQDGFNLFDFLWPDTSPLSDELKSRITIHEKNGNSNEAITCLNSSVAPFFYRVKKKELGLSNQIFNSPTVIKMNKHEKEVYDLIYNRVRTLDLHKYAQNLDLLFNLRRGRIMRMRQAASYIPLLQTVIPDYDEDILHASSSLSSLIANYDLKEIPAKAQYLEVLISTLRKKGHKVLIWSSFVKTLQFLKGFFQSKGIKTDLIFGGTPVESDDDIDIVKTRDYIINDFKNPSGSLEVLIANPAACAESVSLHTGCSHAIYYDLSYNCAQYIQSLDRIHRVGGSEKKAAHYYFLQYENTIDQDILVNLQNKQNRMSAIIDQDYPILDLNLTNLQNDDELGAYERVFNL